MSNLIYSNLSGRNVQSVRPPGAPKTRRYKRWAWLFVIVLIVTAFFKINSSVKAADRARAVAAIAYRQQARADFGLSTSNLISHNSQISFSVSTIDLGSGAAQHFGQSGAMAAASVGKLLTATLYLHQTQTGQSSLNTKIGGFSAKYQLQQMIQQSDDTAWELFNDNLGHPDLSAYAHSLGLSSYDPATNSIGTNDVAHLLADLYQGRLLDSSNTQLLLSYMRNTNYEDFISPAIPRGDKIYHKVGLINDNVNDAAIISNGHQSFVLVIFTDGHGTQEWDYRAELMQQIATTALKAYIY